MTRSRSNPQPYTADYIHGFASGFARLDQSHLDPLVVMGLHRQPADNALRSLRAALYQRARTTAARPAALPGVRA